MWIFDSYFKGSVELWSRERGLERISIAYTSSFYMHLKDPHAYWEMIRAWISLQHFSLVRFIAILQVSYHGFALIQSERFYIVSEYLEITLESGK